MARCYSGNMPSDQPLPNLWLLSDERNDARLELALTTLPKGSGFVFRHYHLAETARQERYIALRDVCLASGHMMILSGDAETATAWQADGIYGSPARMSERAGLLRLATVHDLRELTFANRARVDGMFLSPVFPTRSHPDASCLGIENFRSIAAQAETPVIALGGMTAARAAELDWPRWGAIDGHMSKTP
jgi:thiamine-phosphate pyrophosphorylase